MKTFNIIVAIDKKNGIGKGGKLPWTLPADMKRFKAVTLEARSSDRVNAVIMGRKTWESIPEKWRPLAGRFNVVLTKDNEYILPENVLKCESLEAALKLLDDKEYRGRVDRIFVIGGASLYAQAIPHPLCQQIHLTTIDGDFGCDAFFPEFKENFTQVDCSEEYLENGLKYSFAVYERKGL